MAENIKAMIVSYKADIEFLNLLEDLGIKIIFTKKHSNLPEPVDDHPDFVVRPLTKKIFLVDQDHFEYYQKELRKYGIQTIPAKNKIGAVYPEDVLLNSVFFKGYCVGRKDAMDPRLLEFIYRNNMEVISVKQGYANCSSLIAGENLLITQDKSIYKALLRYKLNVFLLPQGGIDLPGYSTGFIGGTYGMINDTAMVFYGDIERFLHKKELKKRLKEESIEIFCPEGIDFVDRGSMIGIY
ncbi:DUF6873 family GME fold protein [Gallicola sp. Sow4_E12]|uniref:DUF6873 family GME fold protein n=1 Tax=Gallicola sp. Sow4_E12 TaxID=3438785 RepID=UPI003F8E8137